MPQPRRHKRRSGKLIGFKAFVDTDQDIIAWWDSLPPGQGSEALRALIRDHLAAEGDDDLMVRQLEALRIDMNTQFRALAQQLRQMAVAAPALARQMQEMDPAESLLDDEEIAARKRAILSRKW